MKQFYIGLVVGFVLGKLKNRRKPVAQCIETTYEEPLVQEKEVSYKLLKEMAKNAQIEKYYKMNKKTLVEKLKEGGHI